MCARITVVGAGSGYMPGVIRGLLHRAADLAGSELVFHDIDAEHLGVMTRLARAMFRARDADLAVRAETSLKAALDGADFVVCMIQVGGIDATRVDFAVPERFGLRQTIGDTLGAGGVFRALRTFPVLRQITDDMRRLCPDALLLNYTNPMAMNVWWLGATAPDIAAVGLCHSVYWTVRGLCELVDVDPATVGYRAAGVNHQAWLLSWQHDGADLYPRLRELVARDPQLRRRVRVGMFRRLGYYPTETSEHSSEYVPWYLRHEREVERLRLPVGAYVGISEDNVAQYENTRARIAAGQDLDLVDGESEYAPQIIRAMATGQQIAIHANVPNRGLISNLPPEAGVEVPCTVDGLGVHPQALGALPPQCAALNRAFLNVAELTVRAAVTEDALMVRQALMVDPNTSASLTVDEIFALCDAFVEAHGDLLPAWLRAPVQV